MQKILIAGLLLLGASAAALAQGLPQAASAARMTTQTIIPQERAELHGIRAQLKAGTLSREAAHQLILQIRASVEAARHHG